MPTIVVVGGTRGLGHSLVNYYSKQANTTVYGTSRKQKEPQDEGTIKWIHSVDASQPSAGQTLANAIPNTTIDTLIIVAGFFGKESFDKPDW